MRKKKKNMKQLISLLTAASLLLPVITEGYLTKYDAYADSNVTQDAYDTGVKSPL